MSNKWNGVKSRLQYCSVYFWQAASIFHWLFPDFNLVVEPEYEKQCGCCLLSDTSSIQWHNTVRVSILILPLKPCCKPLITMQLAIDQKHYISHLQCPKAAIKVTWQKHRDIICLCILDDMIGTCHSQSGESCILRHAVVHRELPCLLSN